jgi:sugar (pentulose or hexulose) kinase
MTRLMIAAIAAIALTGSAHAGALTDESGHPLTDNNGQAILAEAQAQPADSEQMCHAALTAENGQVLMTEKREALLSTETCNWYRQHHLRACKIGENPGIGRCYISA